MDIIGILWKLAACVKLVALYKPAVAIPYTITVKAVQEKMICTGFGFLLKETRITNIPKAPEIPATTIGTIDKILIKSKHPYLLDY